MENKKMVAFRFSSQLVDRINSLVLHYSSPDMRAGRAWWRGVNKTSVIEALVNAEFEGVELEARERQEKVANETVAKKKNTNKKARVKK